MSETHEGPQEPTLDPTLRRALEALPPIQADPDFQAQLRAQFLQAEVDSSAEAQSVTPARLATPLRRIILWVALAAAGLVAFFFIMSRSEEVGWTLFAGSSGGEVYLDGRATSANDGEGIAIALANGGSVRTPEGVTLSLIMGNRLAVHIGSASEVQLPSPTRETRDGPFQLEARAGHLSVVTGPDFDSPYIVRSPQVEVRIRGTRFAVDISEGGTCVCCTEGTVDVHSLMRSEFRPVEAGAMALGMPDGSLKFASMVVSEHVEPLDALGQAWH